MNLVYMLNAFLRTQLAAYFATPKPFSAFTRLYFVVFTFHIFLNSIIFPNLYKCAHRRLQLL